MDTPLYRQCARMFMVGFPGKELDSEFSKLIAKGLFGAILFARNLGSAKEVAELTSRIKEHAKRPFILAVDQEGGRVARLRGEPFTSLPPMRELGRTGDLELARRVGQLLALELRAVGLDWDFAPVLDVDSNPLNPVIGDRSFGADPKVVASLGVALAKGLEEGSVISCGKHFPGHGDTSEDSHIALPRLPHNLDRLRQVEFVPFRAYAQAGLASIMTAHVVFEALDPGIPATMSVKALDGILRQEIGFQGVVVSDDLEMKAISDNYGIEDAVALGARAGVDLFLACQGANLQHQAIEALTHAVEQHQVPRGRIEEANRRLDELLNRFAHPPEDRLQWLLSEKHRALIAQAEIRNGKTGAGGSKLAS